MSTSPRAPAVAPTSAEAWGQTPAPTSRLPIFAEAAGPIPAIERGDLVVLRQFDVADEIGLKRVRAICADVLVPPVVAKPGAPVPSNPPVHLVLGHANVDVAGEALKAEVSARVFDFGAISIRLKIGLVPGTSWSRLCALVRDAQTQEALTKVAREWTDKLVVRITPAIDVAHGTSLFEDYVVAYIERFVGGGDARVLPQIAVARLLLGERDDAPISMTELEETTANRSSYFEGDLCVIGWSTALVVEPAGELDELDILELANAQLLELRYYDELLDRALSRLYDDVAKKRKGARLPLLRSYGPVVREAMAVLLEIAEFVERAENSLKIIGDVYLSRLYSQAVEALNIPAWERSVTRKQALVEQVYDVLKSEIDAGRGQLLEITVVALILFEIVWAMIGGHG